MHLHIGRLVVDAGSPDAVAARVATFTEALREALQARIAGSAAPARTAAAAGRVEQSLPQRIAAGILQHEAMQPAQECIARSRSPGVPDAAIGRRRP